MNEIFYPIAIAIVISAVVGFFTAGLKKLKSVQLRVDFSEEKTPEQFTERPTSELPEHSKNKFLP